MSCRMEQLLSDSAAMCDESLTHFVKALILIRDPLLDAHAHTGTDATDPFAIESESVLVVELLTAIMLRNVARAQLVWPLLHAHFKRLLEAQPENREYLMERVVSNMMRACIALSSAEDAVRREA